MLKVETTDNEKWQNQLTHTENELKTNIFLLTFHLNRFNESKLTFGRTLRKLFLNFCFFFLRHSKVNLRTWTNVFYKSAASAKTKSEVFGTTLKKPCVLWQANLLILRSPATPMPPRVFRWYGEGTSTSTSNSLRLW